MQKLDYWHWLPRGSPYTTCLLVLLEKLATSHVLQHNKNKTYRGRGKRLSVSIEVLLTFYYSNKTL